MPTVRDHVRVYLRTRGLQAWAVAVWALLSLRMAVDAMASHTFKDPPPDVIVPHMELPPVMRAWLWGGFGLIALVAAMSPTRPRTQVACFVLAFMPSERTFSYAWAAVMHQSWEMASMAVLWFGMFLLVLVTARVRGHGEPSPRLDPEAMK